MYRAFPNSPLRARQHGVALFVVIVFVMLSMLLALWASRTSLFNELVVGNDADYQRAFEAAQALLQDAELDIRNQKANGSECTGAGDICRTGVDEKIPLDVTERDLLLPTLALKTAGCSKGLCIKRTEKLDFWNNTDATKGTTAAQMMSSLAGARYGQFSGAGQGTVSTPINPILRWTATTPANEGGWYWIEVLRYDESSKNASVIVGSGAKNLLRINLGGNTSPNVVYRITALAQGRKPSTQVVLQQTYAPQRETD
ncbi:MAG: pilus assembly protein PilX [Alcaligenaceae bacterium]|nr:MAG: pilus assembly protein PilX [Alcaligenaceae bacterium]